MSTICPKCNSTNVFAAQIAQKTSASIGTIVGAIYGYRIGTIFGPRGVFTGAIAGLINGAITQQNEFQRITCRQTRRTK